MDDFVAALAHGVKVAVPVLCRARIAFVGAPEPWLEYGFLSVDSRRSLRLTLLAAAAAHRARAGGDDNEAYDAAEARAAIGVAGDVAVSVFQLPRGAMRSLLWESPPGLTAYVVGSRATRPAEVPAYVPPEHWYGHLGILGEVPHTVSGMHDTRTGRIFPALALRAVCYVTKTVLPLRIHEVDSATGVADREWRMLDEPHRAYTVSVTRTSVVQCLSFEPFVVDVPRRRWDGMRRAVITALATRQLLAASAPCSCIPAG